jgi:hypothetical protein
MDEYATPNKLHGWLQDEVDVDAIVRRTEAAIEWNIGRDNPRLDQALCDVMALAAEVVYQRGLNKV